MSQNNQKGFFGVVIPIRVLEDTGLTISEKFVYSYICSYGKYCVDDNAKIAQRLGVSVPTVSRSIATLKQSGYIDVSYINNDNSRRKIRDVYGKTKNKADSSCKRLRNNRGDRQSFPQSFTQLLYGVVGSNQNDETSNQNDET